MAPRGTFLAGSPAPAHPQPGIRCWPEILHHLPLPTTAPWRKPWPTGPGCRASTHRRFPTSLLRTQNDLVGWDQPPGTVSPETAGETGSSRTPATALSPPRYPGSWRPVPGTSSCPPSRLRSRWPADGGDSSASSHVAAPIAARTHVRPSPNRTNRGIFHPRPLHPSGRGWK